MMRKTKERKVGGVSIGGSAAISLQSMATTDTRDVPATLAQIKRLAEAGCDIVRVAVPDAEAARALERIKAGCPIPLVADIHFDHTLALAAVERGVDKVRINPGNIGAPERVRAVADACRKRGIPIRIGVNGGSLPRDILHTYGGPAPQAMLESARREIEALRRWDFEDIVLSLKSSSVPDTIAAYRLASEAFPDIPLHLGVTEAGTRRAGAIKSAAAIGALLADGIGDTVRISLTADPVEEVRTGQTLLKAFGLRAGPEVISCPECGRCTVDLRSVAEEVEARLAGCRKNITVAVMGCVVNGPGEAKMADVGVSCGGGEGLLFRRGEAIRKVPESGMVDALMELIGEELGCQL
jgi:(E)-4-hydroxy-3-methylbut-2-enyl-diphosphate synthase